MCYSAELVEKINRLHDLIDDCRSREPAEEDELLANSLWADIQILYTEPAAEDEFDIGDNITKTIKFA